MRIKSFNTRLTCCCRACSPAFSRCSPAARACRRTSPRCPSLRSLTCLARSWRAQRRRRFQRASLSSRAFACCPRAGRPSTRATSWRSAQASIDAQYYLIADDEIGRHFLRALRDAAGRGVRVRLLVDDLYTAGKDELLADLAAFPNVEVRLYNPLSVRASSLGARLLFSLHEFDRINRRMHNKLFIADNSFAILGGRNIADDYFMQSARANFIDLDVLSCGRVVRELSSVFDAYWNSDQVYAIGEFTAPGSRERFDARVSETHVRIDERAQDMLGATSLAQQLESGALTLAFARAGVFADTPDKVAGPTVTEQTLRLFAGARDEVIIASPYFIPDEPGMALIRAVGATEENGRITLVTNSFGSTDEPLAFRSYARYRIDMLKAGMRIYEISPSLGQRSGQLRNFRRSQARLHAKAAAIDGRAVFIGSMNLDARSARTNTEVGLVIESPELAQTVRGLARDALASGAYKLRLSADGQRIEWVETDANGQLIVHTDEPDDNPWLRLRLWLMWPFVSDELL
jgi:putative cardiolipin synthase